jgi:hypothetical protein
MTTIAVNRECMAADTRVVTGGSYYHAHKLFRLGNSIVGTSGDGFACLLFLKWFQTLQRNPITLRKLLGEDFDPYDIFMVELNPGGIVLWTGHGVGERILDDQYATGSGGMAALEAMRHGATPKEAVARATHHDENTGGEVETMYLLPPELLPKRKRRGK